MEIIRAISEYITNLGATLAMPIIFTVIGLAVGMKIKDAVRSGVLYGVGFGGFCLVLDYFMEHTSGAATAISQNLGLSLDVLDLGWMIGSKIAFASPLYAPSIVLILCINILFVSIGLLKTLNIDIWNYWIMITCGEIIRTYTGNYWIGLGVVLLSSLIITVFADIFAPKIRNFLDVPDGVSFPHMDCIAIAPINFALNKLIDMIPVVRNWDFSLGLIQEKIGFWGEPAIIGAVLGSALGIGAGYDFAGILDLTIATATTMVLLPLTCNILLDALAPIAESTRKMVSIRFKGREIYIGMDTSVVTGQPEVLLLGIAVIPVILLLSAILPGNRMLPFVELSGMSLYLVWAVVAGKGNIFRTIVIAVVDCIIFLYCGSFVADIYTQAAVACRAVDGSYVISSISAGNPIYSVFLALVKMIW